MSDLVLIDGDLAQFMPNFGAAVVVPLPGTLRASGPARGQSAGLCVDGDEASVEVAGCLYMTPQYCIPGSGTLKIERLGGDQKARQATAGGKPLLLKGGSFSAVFQVQSPAQQPTPAGPIPDPMPQYSGGAGQFITVNTRLKAS